MHLLARRYRLIRQVKVSGQCDIGAGGVAEKPELRAEARVEIKQVVFAGALVEADIEIEKCPGSPSFASNEVIFSRNSSFAAERPRLVRPGSGWI